MGQNRIPGSKTDRNSEVDFIGDLTRRHCIPILMATPEKQPPYPPIVRQTLSLLPNFARHAGGYCCQIDYTGWAHFSGCVWMVTNSSANE
jgi:hypothetical protein